MQSTIVAIAVTFVLAAWHLRNRRHAGWHVSTDGRFYILAGYPMMMIAAYWLASSPATSWGWALGNAWALSAMATFVWGFSALNDVTAEHERTAIAMESIGPSTGAIPIG